MSKKPRSRSEEIRSEILQLIESHPGSNPSAALRAQFGFTRQALNYFFKKLAAEDRIHTVGYGKGTRYFVRPQLEDQFTEQSFTLIELGMLGADRVFAETIAPFIEGLVSPHLESMIAHCAQALLSNVIIHSAAKHVYLRLSVSGESFAFEIADDGIGAFQFIRDKGELVDTFAAAGRLIKGKHHAEDDEDGLFFAARMADVFHLEANGVSFFYREPKKEWELKEGKRPRGTYVNLTFDLATEKTIDSVFSTFTSH